MDTIRPPVPEPVKRELRQESGFGCCVCGFPFIEYHHIIPYSEETHFRPEDMMALCPNCHSRVTANAMTITEQCDYKKKPYNIKRGYVSGLLHCLSQVPIISFGSFGFLSEGILISIDEHPVLSLSMTDGRLEISCELYDENNIHIASVVGNEWISHTPLPWDLQFKYRHITIRQKNRDIRLVIDVQQEPIILRADFWYNGANLRLGKHGLSYKNKNISVRINNYCYIGMRININSKNGTFSMLPVQNFKPSMMMPVDGFTVKYIVKKLNELAEKRVPNIEKVLSKIHIDDI